MFPIFLSGITMLSSRTGRSSSNWNLFQEDSAPVPPEMPDAALQRVDQMTEGVGGNNISNFSGGITIWGQIYHIVVALTLIFLMASFVVMVVQLAQHGDNPVLREKTFSNLKRNIIAFTILGAIETIVGMSFGLIG